MIATRAPTAAAPPRRRRGRRWPLLAVVGLLVLLGRGLGWFGSRKAAGPSPEAAAAPSPAPAPAPAVEPHGVRGSAGGPAPGGGAAAGDAAAPAGPSAGDPGVRAAIVDRPVAAPALAADRFASLLSVVAQHVAEGRLGDALAARERLRTQPLDAGQQAALAVASSDVEAAIAAACAQLLAALGRGDVLAARRDLGAFAAGDATQFWPWLAQALQLAGVADVGGDLGRPVSAGERPWPLPKPLARNRTVRVEWRGALHVATVVDSRADEVTVRVATATGQSYPTLRAVACEPIAASADEAVEMGFAALHGGEPLLARLWLLRARLGAGTGGGARAEQLAALLR